MVQELQIDGISLLLAARESKMPHASLSGASRDVGESHPYVYERGQPLPLVLAGNNVLTYLFCSFSNGISAKASCASVPSGVRRVW